MNPPDGVIDELVPMLRRLVPRTIDVETQLQAPGSNILIDRNLFEQSLVNLVVNARDAMPRGEGRSPVTTERATLAAGSARLGHKSQGGEFVVVGVADSGSGMNAVTAERVFEPFFTTKPLGKGTGLGLYAVYGIVTHAGGHVTLETAEERGTTFYLAIPVTSTEPPTVAPQRETPTARSGAVGAGGGGRSARPHRAAAGDREGRASDHRGGRRARSAPGGRRRRRHDRPADHGRWPSRMDGVELAAALYKTRPTLRVLFITGNPSPAVEAAQRRPRTRLLLKPFRFDALLAVVDELLA